MKSISSTPSSAQKPKRSHLGEFLPLYKKSGDRKAELNRSSETSGKHDLSDSKIQSRLPNQQLLSNKHQEKKALDISLITIDGSSLIDSGANRTPLYESRVTSTPLVRKQSAKADKKLKNTFSSDSMTLDNDVSLTTKSQKQSKSVSFLIEDNNQAVVKKSKSDDSQDATTGDAPQNVKKNKKIKSEKENQDEQFEVVERDTEIKKKKLKSAFNSKVEEPVQSISAINEQGDNVVRNKKLKKQSKEEKQDKLTDMPSEKTKKAKKQRHQHLDEESEGEPAPKSPKTEFVDNLETLNLGDNTHTLSNLIDEMAVVDKAKKKKQKKTANRDRKQNETEKNQNEEKDEKQEQSEAVNEQNEKRTWEVKRWNKHQLAEKSQNTTVNVDNLPVSLLKGNYKKVLIDHFSKYGVTKGIGEAVVQKEEDPVFTTKVHFDTAAAAVQALEMDDTNLAGNQIRVSLMRPMTETNLVIRIYGHPDKLTDKDVLAAFGDVGFIRSIRHTLRKKKTMATAFVEFEGPEAVKRALKKCVNLRIGGKKIMANQYTIINHDKKDKNVKNDDKKKRRRRGANKAQRGPKVVKKESENN